MELPARVVYLVVHVCSGLFCASRLSRFVTLGDKRVTRMCHETGTKEAKKSVHVGPCEHPVRVVDSEGEVHFVRCNNRRKVKCESCSYLAQGDYRKLLRAGYLELEDTIDEYAYYLLTLTAPSFGAVHRVPKKGRSKTRCKCGCFHSAERDGHLRGVAVDLDTYRFDEVVAWNNHLGKLWNATNTKLKTLLPTMDYIKVAEWQERGALHLHVILRIPRADWHEAVVASRSDDSTFIDEVKELIRSIVVEDRWVWGDKALDMRVIKTGADRERAARYLAKALAYVTKDIVEDAPHRSHEMREHFDRLDEAARDMRCDNCEGGAFACGRLCHRRWGARSSTMSKSRGGKQRRGWCNLRRCDLIERRREYARTMARLDEAERVLEAELKGDKLDSQFSSENWLAFEIQRE